MTLTLRGWAPIVRDGTGEEHLVVEGFGTQRHEVLERVSRTLRGEIGVREFYRPDETTVDVAEVEVRELRRVGLPAPAEPLPEAPARRLRRRPAARGGNGDLFRG